jgi:uncharacterized protein YjbI with pentapeptide repeats
MQQDDYVSLNELADYLGLNIHETQEYLQNLGITLQERYNPDSAGAPIPAITREEADEAARAWTTRSLDQIRTLEFQANPQHVEILNQGVRAWNRWRLDNPTIRPDLRGASMRGLELDRINLSNTDLQYAEFYQAQLVEADFSNSNLTYVGFGEATLGRAKFVGAILHNAILMKAHLYEADFTGADLSGTQLYGANLERARLRKVNLVGQWMATANLKNADLRRANLTGANLQGANLYHADLRLTVLSDADLQGAQLVGTNVECTDFSNARVHGASVWNLRGNPKSQSGLIISAPDEAEVTVDDLEVAQFIYLLLRREKLRNVINTITSKAVLILGRFTDERKRVLISLKDALRQRGYVPILFDFKPSPKRDLTETIQLLANMSKFVVADLTDAKSIPQELSHIIPFLPSVPVQPIILASEQEYGMFEHWQSFNSVLPDFFYEDERHLIRSLDDQVIGPVEDWTKGQDATTALRKKIERLESELAEKAKTSRGPLGSDVPPAIATS